MKPIKSYVIEPTYENIIDTLCKDSLKRNKDLSNFLEFLNLLERPCSIALNGKWGCGKTFFVKQLKAVIEAYNENHEFSKTDDESKIKEAIDKHINKDGETKQFIPKKVVYFDAWVNDNDEDPILSIIYEIIRSTSSENALKCKKGLMESLGAIADFFTGKDITRLIKGVIPEDLLGELKKQKNIHDHISTFLESLLDEKEERLVIIIDELDRCKPCFAVRLLERVKHYFSYDKVTFIFSVNMDELQHTIKHHYGNKFDAFRYLDRFFDFRYMLPQINLMEYYRSNNFFNGGYYYEKVSSKVVKVYNFQLREIQRYRSSIENLQCYKPSPYDRTNEFCLYAIAPIILGLNLHNIDLYNDFVEGRDSSPLIDVISADECDCESLLNDGESYEELPNKTQVKLSDKLEEVYDALFKKDYSRRLYEIHIGSLYFTQKTRDTLMKVTSLFIKFT